MFVDENSEIDKESLRTYVLNELNTLKTQSQQLITDSKHATFWKQLHDTIATIPLSESERNSYKQVQKQIEELPKYLAQWVSSSVDTSERFEFFVSIKAEEISSSDQQHDYFWALQIRHDQLIAVVRVVSRLLEEISKWVTLSPIDVVNSSIFQGLTEYNIEKQIYLEAENIHKKLTKHM